MRAAINTKTIMEKYLMTVTLLLCVLAAQALKRDKTLDIYWVDVEGGGGTLIVTPANESVLIDTGMPGKRDPGRIHKAATEAAGLKKIDHLVTTHFDIDHYGGAADLARLIPIGHIYDFGAPERNPNPLDRNEERYQALIKEYRAIKADRRVLLKAGDVVPLAQSGDLPRLNLRCLAAKRQFIQPAADQNTQNQLCAEAKTKTDIADDNGNSIVLLLEFGAFKFYHGADLTWNLEGKLVCPINLIGQVDVYQISHHGFDVSNNSILIRSLSPTVTVMVNGPRKGCEAETVATLRSTPSIKANYQLHRNTKKGQELLNTDEEFIANIAENCDANYIKLSVAPDSKSYTVTIPGTGHKRTYFSRPGYKIFEKTSY